MNPSDALGQGGAPTAVTSTSRAGTGPLARWVTGDGVLSLDREAHPCHSTRMRSLPAASCSSPSSRVGITWSASANLGSIPGTPGISPARDWILLVESRSFQGRESIVWTVGTLVLRAEQVCLDPLSVRTRLSLR